MHKWIEGLSQYCKVSIFSIDKLDTKNYWLNELPNVQIFDNSFNLLSNFSVRSYYKQLVRLRKVYKLVRPSITHAHYASTYGLLGALLYPKHFYLSLWGSDVYFYPKKSIAHKIAFKFILFKADKLFATSSNLKRETQLYTSKEINLIPFGIDTKLFRPDHIRPELFTVGTVKGLNKVYGIDRLITAFSLFHKNNPNSQCLIYGEGPEKDNLLNQIESLKMSAHIHLMGSIPNAEVPAILNRFNVYCALSRSESFGVAVIEASACEIPVIVSDIGGLVEVVKDKVTGLVVNGNDPVATSSMLELLYNDPAYGQKLGIEGRKFVVSNFDWNENVSQQIDFYRKELKVKK